MFNKTKPFKTPHITKEIESFNLDVMDSLFSNMKEGVYGFESIINDYETTHHLILPTYHKVEHGIETNPPYDMIKNSIDYLYCYDVLLMQPSFLPLILDNGQLWDDLQLFKIPNVHLFVQFLFKESQMDYNKLFIEQYKHYLNGNDRPSHKKVGRYVQSKILNLSSRIIRLDLKRERDADIDHKIIDKGYDFNFRIMIYCKDERYIKPIEDELNGILRELDYYNQLRLVKVNKKEMNSYLSNYIKHEMSSIDEPQILSETELLSMFISNIDSKAETNLNKHEKSTQQSKVGVTHSGLELLPRNPITNREIDESIGERIVSAIKDLKLTKNKIEVISQNRTATLQKVIVPLPRGVKFSDLESNIKNIKATVGYEMLSITQGKEPGTLEFSVPCEDVDIIYLYDLIESSQFQKFNKEAELPIIIGMDTNGEPLLVDLAVIVHLLVSGATGSGKSVFLNCLILIFILMRKPNEINLYLVDPKKVEFRQFDGFPHVKKVITDLSEAEQLMQSLLVEMDRRYEVLSKSGHRKIVNYNKSHPKNKIPYMVVVIDEFNSLKQQYPNVEKYIERLGGEARAAGIHLIIATQNPKAEVISTIIKSNLPSAVSFRQKNNRDYITIFGSGIPYTLMGKGDGVAKLEGQLHEFERFQGAVISLDEDEEQSIYEQLKMRMNRSYMDENEDVIIENEEEPIEKMKRIIAQTGIITVAGLREQMGIRINVVGELMKQLVDEGWLSKEGNRYTLTADESELELYRME